MSDGKLQYEVNIVGTQKAAKGLDDVAAASRRSRDSSYGARQAQENWAKGYRGEVFSEMGENVKRLNRVTRNTNPSLKWMGAGFRSSRGEVVKSTSSMLNLRRGTYSAYTANLAFKNLMRGDFMGAMQNASLSVIGLWKAMAASPLAPLIPIFAAVAAAIALITKRNLDAAEAADKHRKAQKELVDELNRISGTDAEALAGEVADRMVKENDKPGLQKELDFAFKRKIEAEKNAKIWGQQAVNDPEDEAIVKRAKNGMEAFQETSAIVKIYAAALNTIDKNNAPTKDKPSAAGESSQSDADALGRQFTAENRKDQAAGKSSAIDKLRFRQSNLRQDLSDNSGELQGLSGDKLLVARKKNAMEIRAIEREILDLREKGQKKEAQSQKDLRSRIDAYKLSKESLATQLNTIEKRIAENRKKPKTTENQSELLSLYKQRDGISSQIGKGEDPGSSSTTAGGTANWTPGSGFASHLNKSRLTGAGRSFSSSLRGSAFRSTANNKGDTILRKHEDQTVEVKGPCCLK